MSKHQGRAVAIISSYVPRRCGIATFTHDLAVAIADAAFREPLSRCNRLGIVAVNDVKEGYPYGPEVVHEIRQHGKESYRAAADFLNHSTYEAVCIQHEYGIYGGNDGDYLIALLNRLNKPVISVLHTVLAEPSPGQRDVLSRLIAQSSSVVVMARRAEQILHDVFDIPEKKVCRIHHGVPDVPFGDTAPFKRRFELSGRPTILTFGLLGPSKGIETMLDALPPVVREHPGVAYIVLGATHPTIQRESGESYRFTLEKQTVELGIQNNVLFHNRYVSLEDLCDYLRAADIYVTPYSSREQIVSGTLAYAIGCGTAVVSTPYRYAEEMLADGRGRLLEFGNIKGLSEALCELLSNDQVRLALRRRAYEFGREMTWPQVAQRYTRLFDSACETPAGEVTDSAIQTRPAMRLSIPEVRLDHLYRMTDDTGMLQHATGSTPNRHHGYCIDDVARAMIAVAMRFSLFREESVLRLFHTYLSFVHHAERGDGTYHNFMSYDRRWLDENGSDDSRGRVAWSLGYVVSHSPDELSRKLCKTMFESTIQGFEEIPWVRSLAFAILGCHYFTRRFPDAAPVKRMMRLMAHRIDREFEQHGDDDWPWCENVVTYENGRIPQALILAGLQSEDDRLVQRGLSALDWLLRSQTGEHGQVSLIGCKGWLRRKEPKANFDQQPVEIAALIGACKAAYRVSGDRRYLIEMRRCFDWFLGSNDIGLPLIDFRSRGCYDGLTADGVNVNQGAESLLSWLLSLLIMHEMQTGDPTSAG